MFVYTNKASDSTYKPESRDIVKLVTGFKQMKCLGSGTINVGSIQLKNSVDVDKLDGALVSDDQMCNADNVIIFTKKEAIF